MQQASAAGEDASSDTEPDTDDEATQPAPRTGMRAAAEQGALAQHKKLDKQVVASLAWLQESLSAQCASLDAVAAAARERAVEQDRAANALSARQAQVGGWGSCVHTPTRALTCCGMSLMALQCGQLCALLVAAPHT